MLDFGQTDQDREDCAQVSMAPAKKAFPYPFTSISKLHASAQPYIIRLHDAHEVFNPTGWFQYQYYEFPINKHVDIKAWHHPKDDNIFRALHPRSLEDRFGADAYWGLENLIKIASATQGADGTSILNIEQIRTIFEYLELRKFVWLPVLINAMPVTVKRDGTALDPKYPEYKLNPNPNAPMIDMVLELKESSPVTKQLYELLKANPKIVDYRMGSYLNLAKGDKGSKISVGEEAPLSAAQRVNCIKNYPDLFKLARLFKFKTPNEIYNQVKRTFWWNILSSEPLNMELEPPKSPLAGLSLAAKPVNKPVSKPADKPVETAVSKKATSVSKRDDMPAEDDAFDDVPF